MMQIRVGTVVRLMAVGAMLVLLSRVSASPVDDWDPAPKGVAAKCVGDRACEGIDPDRVAPGACIGDFSCLLASGPIAAGACIGRSACESSRDAIGVDSCKGDSACFQTARVIAADACIGFFACYVVQGTVGSGA